MSASKGLPPVAVAIGLGLAVGLVGGLGLYLREGNIEAQLDVAARLRVRVGRADREPSEHPNPTRLEHPQPAPTQRCFAPGRAPVPVAPGRPLHSGALVASPEQTRLAAVDPDNQRVHLVSVGPSDLNAGTGPGTLTATRELVVGTNPAQVLWTTDERLFVTERGSNTLTVLDATTGQRLCGTELAADPYSMALTADGTRLYVLSGLSHTLTALDPSTLASLFTVEVAREPRGLALDATGTTAWLSHLAGEPLSRVDLVARAVRPVPAVPLQSAPAVNAVLGFGLQRGSREGDSLGDLGGPAFLPTSPATPLPSQAWSLALDEAHHRVLVPFMSNRTGREVPPAARLDRYGAGSVDPVTASKVDFALGVFDLQTERWVSAGAPPAASRLSTQPRLGGRGPSLFSTIPSAGEALPGVASPVRLPVASALGPQGELRVASLGTHVVAAVRVDPPAPLAGSAAQPAAPLSGAMPSPQASASGAVTAVNPGWPLPVAGLQTQPTLTSPAGLVVLHDGRQVVWSPWEHQLELQHPLPNLRTQLALGARSLDPQLALGRRLFHSASDARLSSGGLSCGGCHPDARDDGLVWFLQQGPRQTPTLAGRVVAPFNWNGTHSTVEGNIAQTVTRLGGTGLTQPEVDALAAYVQRGLFVPNVQAHALSAEQDRGRALFAGSAGCNTCHDPGRNFTDGQSHELGGLGADERERLFDTPSLRFTGSTGPWFHDGRYATLRAMLRDPSHRMGHVELLSESGRDALEAYLLTL